MAKKSFMNNFQWTRMQLRIACNACITDQETKNIYGEEQL